MRKPGHTNSTREGQPVVPDHTTRRGSVGASDRAIEALLLRRQHDRLDARLCERLVRARRTVGELLLGDLRQIPLQRLRYERLFSYVAADTDAWYVVTGDFVSTQDGTGIVHIAPAFGQDDYEVSLKYGLPVLQPVSGSGRFTADVTDYAGRTVKTLTFEDRTEEGTDKEIIIALQHRGLVLKSSNDYLHSYPHCWRCDNPLIYYARDSWFIRTTQYARQMLEQNNTIGWHPPEIGAGRFENWLEENKDWSLSRDRYWGTPLPIWVNEAHPKDIFAVGSVAEIL